MFIDEIGSSRMLAREKLLLATAALCLWVPLSSSPLCAQMQDPNLPDRKLIVRIEPQYPATLERLSIGGVVRVDVVIGADGTVQSAKLIGGNPILGQSAIAAVRRWKYAPGTKTSGVVRFEFGPHH